MPEQYRWLKDTRLIQSGGIKQMVIGQVKMNTQNTKLIIPAINHLVMR